MACISKPNIHSGIEHQVGAARRGIFPRGQTTAYHAFTRWGSCFASMREFVKSTSAFSVGETERSADLHDGARVALTELILIARNTTIRCNP